MNACVLAVAMLGVPLAAGAAGFGKMTVLSNLGQPLSAEIDLVSVQPEEAQNLAVRLASPDAFQERGVDYSSYLRGMRFQLAKRDNGQYYVRVSSSQAINEPIVDFLIEMTWAGGRIVRQYTDVLDPADYAQQNTSRTPAVSLPATTSPRTTPRPAAGEPLADGGKPAVRQKRVRPARTAAPADAAPAASAAGAETPDTHRVRRGETLGQIAGRYKPQGVSLDQMLYGLYKNNTDAFVNQNINRLKSGAILRLPSREEATAVSSAKAASEIRAHATDWNEYKQAVAASVDKVPVKTGASQTSTSAGKLSAKAEDKAAPAATGPRDVVKLSRGEQAKGNGQAAADARIRALEEEKAARERALREANERVALLEKNMQDMQRLLELRSKAASDLQKQTEAKAKAAVPAAKPTETKPAEVKPAPVKPAATPAPVAAPKVASAPVASKAPAKASAPVAVPASAAAASAVAASPVAASAAAASPAQASAATASAAPLPPAVPVKPASAPIQVDEAPAEQSFLAENGLTLFGGALGVSLLGAALVYFMRKRRSRPSFEDSVLTGGDLKSNTVLGSVGASIVDTSNTTDNSFFTDFSREGLGSIDTDEVDPVAEAEVYMAYGRDAQAEEILKDALLKDGSRQEVRLKLMEIYASRKNLPQFEASALELHGATNGAGPLWQKAAAMGRELDAGNPLYKESAAVSSTAVDEPVAAAEPVAAEPDLDLDFEIGTVKMDAADLAPAMAPVAEAPAAEVDFDLGGSEPAAEPVAEEAPVLDFDFGATMKSEPAPEPVPDTAPEAAPEVAAAPAAEEAPILDFHFDLGDVSQSAAATETVRMNEAPLAAAPAPAADEHTSMGAEVPLNFNFGDLDLSLDKPATDSSTIELGVPDGASDSDTLSFSLDDLEGSAPAGTEDPIETKLDLAKAYMDMGDREGAREILTEAAAEGTEEQRLRAERLLGEL